MPQFVKVRSADLLPVNTLVCFSEVPEVLEEQKNLGRQIDIAACLLAKCFANEETKEVRVVPVGNQNVTWPRLARHGDIARFHAEAGG